MTLSHFRSYMGPPSPSDGPCKNYCHKLEEQKGDEKGRGQTQTSWVDLALLEPRHLIRFLVLNEPNLGYVYYPSSFSSEHLSSTVRVPCTHRLIPSLSPTGSGHGPGQGKKRLRRGRLDGGVEECSEPALHLNLTSMCPKTDVAISTRAQHQKEQRSVKLV